MPQEQGAQIPHPIDGTQAQTYPDYMAQTPPPAYSYNPVVHPPVACPVIIIQQPVTSNQPVNYATKTSVITGAMQIIFGGLGILFQVVALGTNQGGTHLSSGIWCGIFFIIAGVLGVCAGKTKKKNKCLIVGHLVMCIFAAVFAANQFAIGITDAIITAFKDSPYEYNYGMRKDNGVGVVMFIILILLAVAEAVTAIIGSCISCCAVCCNNGHQRAVMPHTFQYVTQPQAVMYYNAVAGQVASTAEGATAASPQVSDNPVTNHQKY